MENKIIREISDPLYGYIYITKTENEVVDSQEFQRLDRLYQTPSTHFVFPNATHTRKAHSLGVMHLADFAVKRLIYRQCEKLRNSIPVFYGEQFPLKHLEIGSKSLDNFDELGDTEFFTRLIAYVRAAALCHDIGHGPYSHIFEDVCESLHKDKKCQKFKHEEMSAKIINERFQPILGAESENIINILLGRDKDFEFLTKIIDGPYDVDKLDYISRDSYHTGALEYGAINYIRVIDGFRVKNKKLLFSNDALDSILNTFTATQHMYTSVYYHKTARIFDFMLFEAMKMVPNYLNNIVNNIDEFLENDDYTFVLGIKHKRGEDDEDNKYTDSYVLLKDILNRKKKYKNIFQFLFTQDVSSSKEGRIDDFCKELQAEHSDLNIIFDYASKVKPIRVDTKSFFNWMEKDNIYDEYSGTTKKLKNISLSHFEKLTKMQIIFNIYLKYEVAEDSKYKEEINRIREEAFNQLNDIQSV